jgi:hypothetical protein
LSTDTGGRAVVNTNGLADGLQQVVADASAYYLLGYTPTRQTDDGKFHEIEVKVRRKGVRLLARKGYWAPSTKEKEAAPAPPVPSGVTQALNVFGRTEGGQRAITWIGFEPAGGNAVPVVRAGADANSVAAVDGSAMVGAGDARTRVLLSWLPRRIEGRAPSAETLVVTAEAGTDGSLIVRGARVPLGESGTGVQATPGVFELEAAPGPVKLTLQLEDRSGETIDRWTERLDVPELNAAGAVLSTPRLLLARSALAYRALAASTDDAVPTPEREFRRTDRVLVRMVAGQTADATPKPDIVATLLSRDGHELVKLAVNAGRAPGVVQTELPLANLAPGEYVVRLGFAADSGRAQHVAFRVVP